MHVVGKMKRSVLQQAAALQAGEAPLQFYRSKPAQPLH
jgi:hypothetical protein